MITMDHTGLVQSGSRYRSSDFDYYGGGYYRSYYYGPSVGGTIALIVGSIIGGVLSLIIVVASL